MGLCSILRVEATYAGARVYSVSGPMAPESMQLTGVLLDRRDLGVGLCVGLLAFAAYFVTLAPGLLPADVAEFQTLAVTLGYAHPTGYPVYLLLAKASTAIPLGDVPYRVNLLSAVMGATAVAGLYLLGRVLVGRRWVPLAGALALAASPTFWSQAIIAEVYTSGLVCMVGVLLGIALWQQTGHAGWLFAAACLGGVSLGVHATHSLMAPAAILLVLLTPQRRKANWAAAVGGAVLGAGITLAAFVAIDRAAGPTSYFQTVIGPSRSVWNLEPEDLDGLLDRVKLSMSAPQFRGLLFSQPPEVTRQKAVDYSVNLRREFPPLWLIAAGAGMVWLGRRNWRMTLLLVTAGATHLVFDLFYDMGGIHVLYLATYVPIAVFGTAGLALAADACGTLAERFRRCPSCPVAWDRVIAAVGVIVVICPMLWADAWGPDGRRTAWLPQEERDAMPVADCAKFHEEVRLLIDDLEDDAIVVTGWCTLYPYYYVAHIEQGRTGMVFIQNFPQKDHFELADSLLQYVEEVSPHRPVYFTEARKRATERFELRPVKRGGATLYRVGNPLAPKP